MFYDLKNFPFTQNLAASWKEILAEYKALDPQRLQEAPWEDLYNKEWEIFTLYVSGRKNKKHFEPLPRTAALLENIPNIYNAGFSVTGPGTEIFPHVGYTNDVLRCHLGLIVPEPDACGIKVGDETYHWHEGECVVFDDMVEHEAWNRGSKPRVVLIIDILK
ncbi:MAG: aspartyl/asparaginyl beta-hydroxylase domain-containing protein [Coxiellaceae bacterium]|nr:aspartyl/asparaginyl beta-hydroxylase domain-containing protein [Coxiellaceae bacterium]